MSKKTIWKKSANIFGGFAYLTMLLQWAWLLVTLAVPLLLSSEFIEYMTMPREKSEPAPTVPLELAVPSFAEGIILVASVGFAIGITLYALYIVPRTVSRAGRATFKKAALATVEHTTRQRDIQPEQKQSLILRYVWLIKLVVVVGPLIGLLVPTQLDLDHLIVTVVGLFLATLSIVALGLQLLIASLGKVPLKLLW